MYVLVVVFSTVLFGTLLATIKIGIMYVVGGIVTEVGSALPNVCKMDCARSDAARRFRLCCRPRGRVTTITRPTRVLSHPRPHAFASFTNLTHRPRVANQTRIRAPTTQRHSTEYKET